MKNDEIVIEQINYQIFNPGGNITALVEGTNFTSMQKGEINKSIMDKYPNVEQVGFLSREDNRLEMAGGEFCLNATRCAVYKYLKESRTKEIEIEVSGAIKKLKGRLLDDNRVEVILEIGKNLKELVEIRKDFTCVKIDGILIAVLNAEKSKQYISDLEENEELAKKRIKEIMQKELVTDEKAEGIVFLENYKGNIKINPVIWVKEIDTLFYETACGSGSLGTAIYGFLEDKNTMVSLVQPSGYSIDIKLDVQNNFVNNAKICGIVMEEKYEI